MGTWQGPIYSGYGWHLVFIDAVLPARVPVFEEVESQVKKAWLDEQEAKAWDKAYGDMRAKYTVLLPAVPDSASPRGEASLPQKDIPSPPDLANGLLQ